MNLRILTFVSYISSLNKNTMEKKNYEQSKKLDNVCYDIRGPVMDEAMRMEARGANILKLRPQDNVVLS